MQCRIYQLKGQMCSQVLLETKEELHVLYICWTSINMTPDECWCCSMVFLRGAGILVLCTACWNCHLAAKNVLIQFALSITFYSLKVNLFVLYENTCYCNFCHISANICAPVWMLKFVFVNRTCLMLLHLLMHSPHPSYSKASPPLSYIIRFDWQMH